MENTKMNEVWLVLAYDGYDNSKVLKAFAEEEDAIEWRDFATRIADDRWNGWYIKKVKVE